MKSHIPRKRFGQNFLQDEAVIHDIIEAIRPAATDALIEIGPGLAALTEPLTHYVQPVHAIEIDRDIAKQLRARFTTDQLILHQADALQFDFAQLQVQIAPQQQLRIVGNLPYNISTALLFHLARFHAIIEDMHFMLQKEVVERIVARPATSDYSRLSVMLQYRFAMHKILDVLPNAFYPAPKVNSAVVRIHPYPTPPFIAKDETQFALLVGKAFSQRRKTLRNNLRFITDAQFIAAHLDPARRPETVSVEEFVRLSNILLKSEGNTLNNS
jgi:16S rRNA (adenine1518-N6/adenine1519-N6)-dimethyltransferase